MPRGFSAGRRQFSSTWRFRRRGEKSLNRLLIERAKRVLMANDLGVSTKPSPALYPHQWNWDSAFIAIGLAHYDLERAKTEIRSLLAGQWRNGMIPHIIYNPASSGYFPDPHRWQIARSSDAPASILTSGITQPPMVTLAVREIVRRENRADFAREVFSALLAYHRWFHRERDPRGEGLVSIIHPWESGMDNSPRWLEILDRIKIAHRPDYQREDDTLVPSDERPTDADYDRFIFLMDLARDLNYKQQEIFANSPFVVQDVLLISILFCADDALRELAALIGAPTAEMERWLHATRDAFQTRLWDDADALYYDFDHHGGHAIRENTIAALMPLYAGLPTQEQAARLVKHLLNPEEYAPDTSTKFRVPTASKSNRYFAPRGYWRGPVWVNTNWFMIRGLERYGYTDLARAIRADTLALVERAGFHEYFDPRTGDGDGTDMFSWSAALVIDLLEDDEP
ncbi:MAG: glycoside hydrolase [Chloroflexota bacterium]|nr:glycoside hydrolase [Chloroflexota bacterium]